MEKNKHVWWKMQPPWNAHGGYVVGWYIDFVRITFIEKNHFIIILIKFPLLLCWFLFDVRRFIRFVWLIRHNTAGRWNVTEINAFACVRVFSISDELIEFACSFDENREQLINNNVIIPKTERSFRFGADSQRLETSRTWFAIIRFPR